MPGKPDIGELLVTAWHEGGFVGGIEKLRIDRADPRVWMTSELLQIATQAQRLKEKYDLGRPWIEIAWKDPQSIPGLEPIQVIEPFTATVHDSFGQEFIYRFVEYDHQQDRWLLEWPD